MTLDRKDYKSAIPQLEKRLEQIEKLGKDVFNKFEDIAHQTQLDAAEAEKKNLALDYQLNTLQVHMEYALVANGYDPSPTTQWSETVPTIDGSTSGMTLWYRSVTLRNNIVIQRTDPQKVNLMDGVYTFINSVSSTDPITGEKNWTTIDGGTIQTGTVSADHIAVGDIIIGQSQVSGLPNALTNAEQRASLFITQINDGGITVHDAYDSLNLARITSDGMEVVKGGDSYAQFGVETRIGRNESGYSRVLIDPLEDVSSGVTNIFTITASNDAPVQKVVLDPNHVHDGTVETPYYRKYVANSFSNKLTTSAQSSTAKTFTISDVSDIASGTDFSIKFVLYYERRISSTESELVPATTVHTFSKGTSKTDTETFSSTAIQTVVLGVGVQHTATIIYNGAEQFTVSFSAKLKTSSSYSIYVDDPQITLLSYEKGDVMIPINQQNGDVIVCASQNAEGDYLPLGRFYIGMDASTGEEDLDLYDALDALGWAVSPIIV